MDRLCPRGKACSPNRNPVEPNESTTQLGGEQERPSQLLVTNDTNSGPFAFPANLNEQPNYLGSDLAMESAIDAAK